MPAKEEQQELFFGEAFLEDHAGSIIREPRVALIELIANAYDAGATKVEIDWPNELGGKFAICDNGSGMTKAEFNKRWKTLSYNRLDDQGRLAENPNKIPGENRVAFGRSGKGRHGAFCFSDSYDLTSRKGGHQFSVRINRTSGRAPFKFDIISEAPASLHGTTISSEVIRNYCDEKDLREIIGCKFSVIPSFQILLNHQPIQLLDLKHLLTCVIEVQGVGNVTVHQVDSETTDRTTHLRGICWWVKGRAVGNPSWEGLDGEGAYLDGRSSLARRYTFIVEADVLELQRKPDWTGFYASKEFNAVKQAVHSHVIRKLNELQSTNRAERKKVALQESKTALREMNTVSRQQVASFVDEIQEKCPTISERDLGRAAQVFATMESAFSGYDLLKRLESCSPEDIDTWNDTMMKWSAKGAATVLGELENRLKLIVRMQSLVNSPLADELHDLQPLFERGLWIFGPEYEGVQFHSNRGLATTIRHFLGGTEEQVARKRHDFVALPDSSIGAYSAPAYDAQNSEICGIRQILVLELKKGGFELTQKELDQARDYAKDLIKGSDVLPTTQIICYVLGAKAEVGLEESRTGERIRVIPMRYDTVLARAESRTFGLHRKMEQMAVDWPSDRDPILDAVLSEEEQTELALSHDDGSIAA